ETNSIVDIGYHYVALDANGRARDFIPDGIPDYLADANGNGVNDPGETPWWAAPPSITTQPAAQSAWLGDNVVFTVVAGGATPVSYQWQFNGVNLPGETNPTLTLYNVSLDNAGNYTVIVSNLVQAITSDVASLGVMDPMSYLTLSSGAKTNFVFRGDATYYIN